MKNIYRAFGTDIYCDFPLAPCPRATGVPAIRVSKAATELPAFGRPFHTIKNLDGSPYSRFLKAQKGYCVVFDGQGTFFLDPDGRKVLYHFNRKLSDQDRATLLLHHLLPLALSLSGQFVIHGAAVARRKKGQIIVGGPGIGKSTLALSLSKKGYSVLSDDAVIVRSVKGGYRIFQSTPMIRLWSKSGRKKEAFIQSKKIERAGIPLTAVHFPEFHEPNEKARKPARRISSLEAIAAALPEVFRLDLDRRELVQNEFTFLAGLCAKVPAYAWPHRHDRAALERARKLLVAAETAVLPFSNANPRKRRIQNAQ